MHDNTELRRLETIRSEFMANVSHELKTPLSSIKAYCETLMNGAVDDHDNRHRFLQRIEEQGDRLNDLIQDMLSLARIESAQQHLDLVTLDVGEVVGRCVDDYRARAESRSRLRYWLVSRRRPMLSPTKRHFASSSATWSTTR